MCEELCKFTQTAPSALCGVVYTILHYKRLKRHELCNAPTIASSIIGYTSLLCAVKMACWRSTASICGSKFTEVKLEKNICTGLLQHRERLHWALRLRWNESISQPSFILSHNQALMMDTSCIVGNVGCVLGDWNSRYFSLCCFDLDRSFLNLVIFSVVWAPQFCESAIMNHWSAL